MTLEALKSSKRVIGLKQVTKAVKRRTVECVFVADDAEAHVVKPLTALASEFHVPLIRVATMKELGAAAHIDVGAATAAIVK